jgi:hypothetical protein
MEMLRLLIVKSNECFSRGPIFLPNELRVLDWPNCPLESFPSSFEGKKLAILRMHRSFLKGLEGDQVQLLFLGKLCHESLMLPLLFV